MRSITSGLTLWTLWIAFAGTGAAATQAPAAPSAALLQVDKRPAEPLDVVVYDLRAASFDRPLAEVRGVGPAGARIPAGALLVALRSGRKAPDLHRLTVRPGGTARLAYRSREGWSLVLRVVGGPARQPVPSAVASLRTAQEGAPVQPAGEEKTGAEGLALFSAIAALRVDAEVASPAFLPQELPGLAGAAGALVFRDAFLDEGGSVRAVVQAAGRPLPGALCRMVRHREEGAAPALAFEGRTDAAGVCHSGRVAAGTYRFSVIPGNGLATLHRQVTVQEGEEAREDVSFSRLHVHGTVTRGGRPVSDSTVSVTEGSAGPGAEVTRATTGADGTYQLDLSQPGPYVFRLLTSATGATGLERSVSVQSGDTAVDFALRQAVIAGRILDQQQRPLAGAWVRLHWNDAPEAERVTDDQGEFTFLLDSDGAGTVVAGKDGYQDSDPQEYEVDADEQFPPLVLILHEEAPPG